MVLLAMVHNSVTFGMYRKSTGLVAKREETFSLEAIQQILHITSDDRSGAVAAQIYISLL